MRKLLVALLLSGAASSALAESTLPQAKDSYFKAAQAELAGKLQLRPNTNRATNIILFIGDGMGISTLTAARIYSGQARNADGESSSLAIDRMPYSALVKTYSHDAQVSDSAPTATALTTGVKTRNDIVGLDQTALVDDCAGSRGKAPRTIFEIAETMGRATGVVSTARITHATPAAAYAHVANRDWENDSELPVAAKTEGCIDIARQLVEWPYGDGFEVVLGGGRAQFLPTSQADPEALQERGFRTDGRDLVAEWRRRHPGGTYIWNKAGFDALQPGWSGPLLGLFERDHMEYEADRARDAAGEPSLAEMTRKAIATLSIDRDGFILMVESGRIDHAHHEGNAARALQDVVELDRAVEAALSMVDLDETLIIVTADHSHTMTINGYPRRGNPILGHVVGVTGELTLGTDARAYTTLSYATGPGGTAGVRSDPGAVDTQAVDYKQQALVPMRSATHAGEDVVVRAAGPYAHLLEGTIEQNLIFHVMVHAAGVRESSTAGDPLSTEP